MATKRLVDASAELTVALEAEYGRDYAFVIMGRGEVVAASNDRLGIVTARHGDYPDPAPVVPQETGP